MEGLVGQNLAKKWLLATLESGNLPQALIFAGPEGVGKKTVAKLVARYLHGSEKENHPDTFWFSRILDEVRKGEVWEQEWINAVRSLIHKLALSPMVSKYKVAIIEDADRLSEAAQNALLKNLEEPREDTVIILIVPSEKALLPTIVSRSQIVHFSPLKDEEVRQIVAGASEEQIQAGAGSAGKIRKWVEDGEAWENEKKVRDFWKGVRDADIPEKLMWSVKIKEREDAINFIHTGMLVYRDMLPEKRAARGLKQMGDAIEQIRDNVNLRGAIDTLLLAL